MRSFVSFLCLGLFWGLSPSLYKHLTVINMPVSHTICLSGLAVGAVLYVVAGVGSGRWRIPFSVLRYGAICAALMNGPFALNLFLAAYVPPTELAIAIAASPFFNYLFALMTGWETTSPRRLLAIVVGFTSTLVLILSRDGMLTGHGSWWLLAAPLIPLLYCAYNGYASRGWPRAAHPIQAGAAESVASGLIALPVVLTLAPFGAGDGPAAASYWVLLLAIAMWIVERITYFTLVRDRGAVYTMQATYVSAPVAVMVGALFFGGAGDQWLWVSLAILIVALWLNNSGPAAHAKMLREG